MWSGITDLECQKFDCVSYESEFQFDGKDFADPSMLHVGIDTFFTTRWERYYQTLF